MWEAASGGSAVTGYQLFQADRLVRDLPADKTMVDVTGLSPLTAYAFAVRAKDAAGHRSPSARPPASPRRPPGPRTTGRPPPRPPPPAVPKAPDGPAELGSRRATTPA